MNRPITAVAVTLVALLSILPTMAYAADMDMPAGEHKSIGLGFHNDEAPVGLRWWFAGQRVGLDLGLGYESFPSSVYADEDLTSWAVDFGVPIVVKSWSRVHVLFRPGLLYQSAQTETDPTGVAPFDTEDIKSFFVSGELEAEVFLMENFSVSASTGLGYQSIDPPGSGDKLNSFFTLGNNFTNIGFHVYLFGAGGH